MPLPMPKKNQDHDKWIDSCMSSDLMNKEFPDNRQRYAVCESQWKRAQKKRSEGEETESWDKTQAEIESSGIIHCNETIRILRFGPPVQK